MDTGVFGRKRKQVVRVNNEFLYEAPVQSGVPHTGICFRSLLFVLYVNDISSWVKFAQVQTFADDTKISYPISTSQDRQKLQQDLNILCEWSIQNNMVLNTDKYELINHRIKTKRAMSLLRELPYESDVFTYSASNSVVLYPSSTVRDLGVIVDAALTWKHHVAKIRLDGIKMCCWILNVFKTRQKDTMMLLCNSLFFIAKTEY